MTTMKDVKVYYFLVKARAEGMRMMLAFGGQDFEDIRIPMDEWPEFKQKMNFIQLPVLEIDGKRFPQSVAATRFLGRQYKLAGADDKEDYEIDAMVDLCNDIFSRCGLILNEPDPEVKNKSHERFSKEFYPAALAQLDKTIQQNGGYLANGKLSWGDFFLVGMYDFLKVMLQMPDLGEKYPNIKALHDTVLALPKVKAWAETAPASVF